MYVDVVVHAYIVYDDGLKHIQDKISVQQDIHDYDLWPMTLSEPNKLEASCKYLVVRYIT
jgi:hypothetical protein